MRKIYGFALALALGTQMFAAPLAATAAKKHPAPGGALQRLSVEGCMNTYLFDGVWRVKVLGFEKGSYYGTPGYAIKIQVRNGTSKQLEPSYTGFGGQYGRNITMVMSDDSSVAVETVGSNTGDYNAFMKDSVPPGAADNAALKFYPPQSVLDSADIKPKKLLIEVDPKAINPDLLPFRYPTADPSFRVKLNCSKT